MWKDMILLYRNGINAGYSRCLSQLITPNFWGTSLPKWVGTTGSSEVEVQSHNSLVNSGAMVAVKLEHTDLVQHQSGILQQFRSFWMEDHLCDVVLKSCDGAEHGAHTALLSAASVYFKNLLGGSFLEADRVQRKQPVIIAASRGAVSALLDYIYGGQPEVNLQTGLELLRLAEACNLPTLAKALEAGIDVALDSNSALQVLQQTHGLHRLKDACEEKVAQDFESCSQKPDFGKLSAGQLARILKREDLVLSREETVLQGIFSWLSFSKDRHAFLGMLLQLVDFQSLSFENLLRLGRSTLCGVCGLNGEEHQEVDQAQTTFVPRDAVSSIGHRIWVALKLHFEKCCLFSVFQCAGTKVPFMPWTTRTVSFVGGLMIRLQVHGRLRVRVPKWPESMTSGGAVTCPSRPKGTFLCMMGKTEGFSGFNTDVGSYWWLVRLSSILFSALLTECSI